VLAAPGGAAGGESLRVLGGVGLSGRPAGLPAGQPTGVSVPDLLPGGEVLDLEGAQGDPTTPQDARPAHGVSFGAADRFRFPVTGP